LDECANRREVLYVDGLVIICDVVDRYVARDLLCNVEEEAEGGVACDATGDSGFLQSIPHALRLF